MICIFSITFVFFVVFHQSEHKCTGQTAQFDINIYFKIGQPHSYIVSLRIVSTNKLESTIQYMYTNFRNFRNCIINQWKFIQNENTNHYFCTVLKAQSPKFNRASSLHDQSFCRLRTKTTGKKIK